MGKITPGLAMVSLIGGYSKREIKKQDSDILRQGIPLDNLGNPSIRYPSPESEPGQALPNWKAGDVLEIAITDLSATGDGLGRWETRVVFVPDTVPGDRVRVRLSHVKPRYGYGTLLELISPGPDRIRPACIVADKCGGCQWQTVGYELQMATKQEQVKAALERIGKFEHVSLEPIIPAPHPLGYRNKVTYPLAFHKGQVQAGYYRKGSHRIVNLNQCPVQDARLNPLLAGVKLDIQDQAWSIYNELEHTGALRHLGLRIGRRTGEILLTLVTATDDLPELESQAAVWMATYPGLVGVCLNYNTRPGNQIFGPETEVILGQSAIREQLAGLEFAINATSFFQVNTEQAEALVQIIQRELQLTGQEIILDAFCGVGTLSLPLASQARAVVGVEISPATVAQAQHNAEINQISNAEFRVGDMATWIPTTDLNPDIVLLDPPRKGCDAQTLTGLEKLAAPRIVYVSCNPATLARDLDQLCHQGNYLLTRVQPLDFFPQTAHVETVAFLNRRN